MSVLAVAEHRRGEVRDVSFELVTAGRRLADALSGELNLLVVGGDVDSFAEDLNRDGVDTVYTVDDGEEFNRGVHAAAIERLHADLEPTALVAPNSVDGLDYAPAVAQRLDVPLVTDVIDFEVDGGGIEVTSGTSSRWATAGA